MRSWLTACLLSLLFVAVASVFASLISYLGSHSFGDWQLLFLQLKSQSRWLLLTAIAFAIVTLIVKLNEYERQLISPSLGWTLLGLRLSLVFIIFLTLMEPVWVWSYDTERLGRVVVALDVSESMDTDDEHAALVEKLRWGRSLGMFSNGGSQDQVTGWIRALETGNEPEWVSAEEEPNPIRRQQRAARRRQDIEETLENVTDYSRLALSLKTLVAKSEPFVDQLAEYAQTELAIFAEGESRTDKEQLEKMLSGDEILLDRQVSDLSEAVNSALKSDSEIPLAGMVLFSDGRDTSQGDLKKLVQRVAGLGIPIHTVLVGSERRPRDLAVSHVDAPETVFEDDSPIIKSIVHLFGYEGEDVEVFLDFLDDPDREPLSQMISSVQPSTEVSFKLDDLDRGRHRFRVRIASRDDELREDNNSREMSMSVVDDKARVLLLEGEGRWEFRYLHAALERDKRVELDEVVFDQPFLGILDEPFFHRRLSQLDPSIDDSTPFANYDCVVIGDVSPREIPLVQWRNLERYVRDEGGTIVLTAGKRDFPLAFRGTVVDSLFPIENLRTIELAGPDQFLPPAQRGFRFSITPDGEQMAMFQLGEDWNESRAIWSRLPGHSWGITGTAKGGATVFAAALRPGERPTLDTERENGIVVQHYVGSGQVVWIGVDSTWRWRFRVGDMYHHRFWGQLIRWAVGFKATAGNQNVRLGLTRSVMNEDESTRIQARWDDRFLAQHPQLKSVAIVTATDGSEFRRRVELAPAENRSFMHEADLSGLNPGEYSITLETPGIPWDAASPETTLVVREEVSEELADISADRALMEEIATAAGGKFFYLDEAGQIPELFKGTQDSSHIREEIPLWSHWLILVLFSFIAMSEWVTRKLNGLP